MPDGRLAGFEVVSVCAEPACSIPIHRGLFHLCGDYPGSNRGCGRFFCPAHLYVGLPYGSQQCGHCNAQPVVDLADTNQRQRVADASGVPAHLLAPAGTVPPLPPLPEGGRLRPSAAA
ncbi:hypothetical protein [Fodinicola feengrottensis]